MNKDQLVLASMVCGALSLALVFSVVILEQYFGMDASRTPLSWALMAGAILFAIPVVAVYYRVDWQELTGGRGGPGLFVIYLAGALALAALLNAIRLAIFR